jgi:hypothetical protein
VGKIVGSCGSFEKIVESCWVALERVKEAVWKEKY